VDFQMETLNHTTASFDYASLQPGQINELLETPCDDRRPLKASLRKFARVNVLVGALELSSDSTSRMILCDILADRKVKTAVPALVECLNDPDPWVVDAAAEALAKIGSPLAGPELLTAYRVQPSFWIAVALGAVHVDAAVPDLIVGLRSESAMVRAGSAWALGWMRIAEARLLLISAAKIEQDEFALSQMQGALEKLSTVL
jgi:HEAT repeat protein